MSFGLSLDDGGSPITDYKLYADSGNDFTSAFTELTNYDGSASTYTVTVTGDSLTAQRIYRFRYVATNEFGDSEQSNELIAGLGAPPPAPNTPTKIEATSNST